MDDMEAEYKPQNMSQTLPRGCRLINLPEYRDKRGCLSIAELGNGVPFAIKRVFWIYDVPEGETRGAHSHDECAEVVVPVHGAFDMMVDDGVTRTTVRLDSPHQGILIPAGVWCQLSNFAPDTVCVVMASHPYKASGYTHDYSVYKGQVIEAVPYNPNLRPVWNKFVAESKNGTFLFQRDYMDYHADRFVDCSLLFYKKDELVAVLPANYKEGERRVYSHGGLTYGGLVLSENISVADTMQVMTCAMEWMKLVLGAEEWIYKPVPHIYHRMPAEEDLYALFRNHATIEARAVSSAIDYAHRLPLHKSRRYGANKAHNSNVLFEESDELYEFWNILDERLRTRHNNKPVHTADEMQLLKERFPENIRLFVAKMNGEIVAGSLVYETELVAHTQYIASTELGRSVRALDGLLKYLIESVFSHKCYFDFGTSMEPESGDISEGLLMQKCEFGARTIVYDAYCIDLKA